MCVYEYRRGHYRRIRCDVQKSIKLDEETYKIINNIPGKNFSQKIRNMAIQFEKQKVLQNSQAEK